MLPLATLLVQCMGLAAGMVVSQAMNVSVPGELGRFMAVKVQPPMPPHSQVPRPSTSVFQPTSSLISSVCEVPSEMLSSLTPCPRPRRLMLFAGLLQDAVTTPKGPAVAGVPT